MTTPLERLRYHVTGAIERGESEAIAAIEAPLYLAFADEESAIAHRTRHGCGGWIFASNNGRALLYACGILRGTIMRDNSTSGLSGRFL